MIEQLILEDNAQDDTDYYMNIRRLADHPIETPDDKEFTHDKVKQTIENFNPRKAPGPDGITSETLKLAFKSISKTGISIYSHCFKRGCFPRIWKTAKTLPITKSGNEDSLDPFKYRPITMLNMGGKVLEKILINGIMHHNTKLII